MEIQTDNEADGYPFPCFSFDSNRCVTLNTAYTMSSNSGDVRCILGVLNSRLGKYLTKLYVTQLQERQFRMLAQYVTKFPIPRFSAETQKYLLHLVKDVLENKSAESERAIDEYVEMLYGLNDSERIYIHQEQGY